MFNIPKITKNLLIINVIVYLATLVMWRGLDLNDVFGLHFFLAPDFHFYQFFTYMFMHAGFMHLFLNMFALWMFGCVVENVWGPKKFLFYYMACGVGAGLFQELAQFVQFHVIAAQQVPGIGMFELLQVAEANAEGLNTWTTVGASGAVYGILLAFGMIFPEQRIFIFPFPFPIKAKWFVIIYAGLEVAQALSTPGAPRRYGFRLYDDTLLALASGHRIRRGRRNAVFRQHARLMGEAEKQMDGKPQERHRTPFCRFRPRLGVQRA